MFTLPSSADQAVFDDDGVAGNNSSRLRSNDGTFETTVFGNPASSLTLNAGAGDSVAVNFLDPLGTADLNIGSLTNAAVRPDSILVDNVVTTGTVVLAASGTISETSFDATPDITASALAMLASGGILGIPEIQVATVAAANTGSGSINFNNFGDFAIGTVGGIVGITTSDGIHINQTGGSAGNLTINSPVNTSANIAVLVAIGPGSMLTSNAAVSALHGVYLVADRMALAGGTSSSGAAVSLGTDTPSLAIDLGAQTDAAAGTLELSDAELDTINAPILSIGDMPNGNITVSNPITAGGHYTQLSLTGNAVIDGTASEQAELTSPDSVCSPRTASAQRTISILRSGS